MAGFEHARSVAHDEAITSTLHSKVQTVNRKRLMTQDRPRVKAPRGIAGSIHGPSWVAAQEPIPTDVQKVGEHREAVAQDVDLGRRIVRPANRHFFAA